MSIDPRLPPILPGGPGGGGGDCQPGEAAGPSSITISPNQTSSGDAFVAEGTLVQLEGNARVRIWRRDCTFSDHQCRSIEWSLFYTPINGATTDVTSILISSPQSNSNSFVAGIPGHYRVVLGCLELALQGSIVAADNIFVGSSLKLNGSATVWIQISVLGSVNNLNQSGIGIDATLLTSPSSNQVFVQVKPIILSSIAVTQQSADGTFDSTTGILSMHFVGSVTGQAQGSQINGNIDIVLSTEGSITPPGGNPTPGKRRGSDGSVSLVGNAPITHLPSIAQGQAWIQINGTLTAV